MGKNFFGTDGIRGMVNTYPITAQMALKFATAAGGIFRGPDNVNRVVIAKDCRLSGYLLEPALVAGFIGAGMDVILVGPMPTPAIPMLIKSLRADLGVMISASHNLAHDNGFKMFDSNGRKLDDKLQNQIYDSISQDNLDQFLVAPEKLGRAKRLEDAQGRYIEYVKKAFPKNESLEGMRIVLDCANGAAYKIAPTIFWELGAEVITIANQPNGLNINDGCGAINPESLCKKVIETRADIGIALDGDADRLIVCDQNGKILSTDYIVALIARYLHQKDRLGNGVVCTYMSNSALKSYIKALGVDFYTAKIGDRHVFEEMEKTSCNLGAEQSGHIILKDYSSTGDGIVAALYVLRAMKCENCSADKLRDVFALNPQVTRNIPFKDQNPLHDQKVSKFIEQIKKKHSTLKILIRESGTESLIRLFIEGNEENVIGDIANKIEGVIKKAS